MKTFTLNSFLSSFLNCDYDDVRVFLAGRDSVFEVYPMHVINTPSLLALIESVVDDKFASKKESLIRENKDGVKYLSAISFNQIKKELRHACDEEKNKSKGQSLRDEIDEFSDLIEATQAKISALREIVLREIAIANTNASPKTA